MEGAGGEDVDTGAAAEAGLGGEPFTQVCEDDHVWSDEEAGGGNVLSQEAEASGILRKRRRRDAGGENDEHAVEGTQRGRARKPCGYCGGGEQLLNVWKCKCAQARKHANDARKKKLAAKRAAEAARATTPVRGEGEGRTQVTTPAAAEGVRNELALVTPNGAADATGNTLALALRDAPAAEDGVVRLDVPTEPRDDAVEKLWSITVAHLGADVSESIEGVLEEKWLRNRELGLRARIKLTESAIKLTKSRAPQKRILEEC
mmetsp:Transcript_11896/g.39128  ORF Transcript_11896/g.39128 Transcript_11896/m.39128 type:complete len:261 (+) Transcript_11896:502-1284(+)